MGKVNLIITKRQREILKAFQKDPFLRSQFYFTGGTALSLYYLQHRISEDLDFFTENPFDPDQVGSIVDNWSKQYNFETEFKQIENLTTFLLKFHDGYTLKLDFNLYQHKRVEKSKLIDGIEVDNLTDIAINKLITIVQRTQVKDFVDLYFLLKKFTIWDLIAGVRVKFGYKTDPLLVASDFLKVENFEFLPIMIKPLKLEELKDFFREHAKRLGKVAVE